MLETVFHTNNSQALVCTTQQSNSLQGNWVMFMQCIKHIELL